MSSVAENKQEDKVAQGISNIIVVGQAKGTYRNDAVTKEFEAKVLVSARPDGTVIVHNLSDGVRPIAYIDGGATISICKNNIDSELDFLATSEDGQELLIQFTDVVTMQGMPDSVKSVSDSLAMSILQCVFDMGGMYGRTTIARVISGSVSKKILTINVTRLDTYGAGKDATMKEILALIDWLIEENYLAFTEDTEFPILVVTSKGLGILADDRSIPMEARVTDEEIKERQAEAQNRQKALDDWKEKKGSPDTPSKEKKPSQ